MGVTLVTMPAPKLLCFTRSPGFKSGSAAAGVFFCAAELTGDFALRLPYYPPSRAVLA